MPVWGSDSNGNEFDWKKSLILHMPRPKSNSFEVADREEKIENWCLYKTLLNRQITTQKCVCCIYALIQNYLPTDTQIKSKAFFQWLF